MTEHNSINSVNKNNISFSVSVINFHISCIIRHTVMFILTCISVITVQYMYNFDFGTTLIDTL
jgi:hypothetical protein